MNRDIPLWTSTPPAGAGAPGTITLPAGDLAGDGCSGSNPTISELTGVAGIVQGPSVAISCGSGTGPVSTSGTFRCAASGSMQCRNVANTLNVPVVRWDMNASRITLGGAVFPNVASIRFETIAGTLGNFGNDVDSVYGLTTAGRRNLQRRTISASYTVDSPGNSGDDVLLINTAAAAGPLTITLPPPRDGRRLWICDSAGQASIKPITITPPDGALINGAASHVLDSDRAGVTILADGSNWTAIAVATPGVLSLPAGDLAGDGSSNAAPRVSKLTGVGGVVNGPGSALTIEEANGITLSNGTPIARAHVNSDGIRALLTNVADTARHLTIRNAPSNPYAVDSAGADEVILKSGGSIVLPPPRSGRRLWIRATSGDQIILNPTGGALVDGAASGSVTGNSGAVLIADGVNWWVWP